MNNIRVEGDHIRAEAGAALDKVCELACKAGLAGMENYPEYRAAWAEQYI